MKPIQCFRRAIACCVLCLCNVTVYGGITFTNLFSFSGTNGSEPEGQLLQTSDGNLYGTTRETTLEKNGNSGFGFFGHGTVFQITTNGAFATLATLAAFNDTNGNGAFPRAGLIEGADGSLYGTTAGGGANRLGTVFKITTNGNLTFIASFVGTNGSISQGGLLRGKKNLFYGTTSTGGPEKNKLPVNALINNDAGTVFSITSDGVLKTLAFFDGTNGADPNKIFFDGKDGNIYGTTGGGGIQNVVPTDNGLPTGFGTAGTNLAQKYPTTKKIIGD